MIHIAISGKAGCGNTTISKLLGKEIGLPIINYTFKQLAKEKNMTVEEMVAANKVDEAYSKYVDLHQIELAQQCSCILASRMAIWLLKDAVLKVYLYASQDERITRIYKREGGNIEKIRQFTKERDNEDYRVFKKLYNIDYNQYTFADLILNTEEYSPKECVELIKNELLKVLVQNPKICYENA